MKLIDVARKEIGTKESNGGDDKYIAWYGGLPLTSAWCAIFVSWCANKLGVLDTIIPKFCDCDAGVRWFKSHDLYQLSAAYGGTYVPKENDIIFFSDKHTQADSTHVGIVDKVSGMVVITIEGNTGDAVKSKMYSLNSKSIIGYGTPLWVAREVTSLRALVNDLSTTPTLRKGSKGPIVKSVQVLLISKGYSCGINGADGIYGKDTKDAVKRYQKKVVGLKIPDGVITAGKKTWKSLLEM